MAVLWSEAMMQLVGIVVQSRSSKFGSWREEYTNPLWV